MMLAQIGKRLRSFEAGLRPLYHDPDFATAHRATSTNTPVHSSPEFSFQLPYSSQAGGRSGDRVFCKLVAARVAELTVRPEVHGGCDQTRPEHLTISFARRFLSRKRDPELIDREALFRFFGADAVGPDRQYVRSRVL